MALRNVHNVTLHRLHVRARMHVCMGRCGVKLTAGAGERCAAAVRHRQRWGAHEVTDAGGRWLRWC
eukprot:210265-Pelagomonas_calceolata.AAC.12